MRHQEGRVYHRRNVASSFRASASSSRRYRFSAKSSSYNGRAWPFLSVSGKLSFGGGHLDSATGDGTGALEAVFGGWLWIGGDAGTGAASLCTQRLEDTDASKSVGRLLELSSGAMPPRQSCDGPPPLDRPSPRRPPFSEAAKPSDGCDCSLGVWLIRLRVGKTLSAACGF